MYKTMEKTREIYSLLQDNLSKEVFKARLAFDLEPTMTNAMNLLLLNQDLSRGQAAEVRDWKKTLQVIKKENKNLAIYGAGGCGKQAARTLFDDNIEFYGFCGRKGPEGYSNGMLMGKPVISPQYLLEHKSDFYVMICTTSFSEIMDVLNAGNFPQEYILHCFDYSANERQYFEFPKLYRKGTAFIDGGCLNCDDDYRFASWCDDAYSYIMAFEPDPKNHQKCEERLNNCHLRNMQLIKAGLARNTAEATFSSNANGGSYLVESKPMSGFAREKDRIIVKTYALDELVSEKEIGFIKLDIEGAEWDALHGAQKTIIRDKPLLALSVYHRNGDVLALMDYLNEMVPEYRFWLRHYGPLHYETVLYASVD